MRDVRAAPDSNRDGVIDNRDVQQPGEVLTLVLDAAFKGSCPAR